MKSSLECMQCFVRQAVDAAVMSTKDQAQREQILREVLKRASEADLDQAPPVFASEVHRIARRISGVTDPYRAVKDSSTKKAEELFAKWGKKVVPGKDTFETALRLAIAGNIIDFGTKSKVTDEEIEHAIRDSLEAPIFGATLDVLREDLRSARAILYLADNVGETVFDRALIEQISPEKVTYVVKSSPCINDATMEDAEAAGLTDMVEVIENGCDAAGTPLQECFEDLKRRFNEADVVISKGQANYETLSDEDRRIVFLFKAKCGTVARNVGCELDAMVMLISDKARPSKSRNS